MKQDWPNVNNHYGNNVLFTFVLFKLSHNEDLRNKQRSQSSDNGLRSLQDLPSIPLPFTSWLSSSPPSLTLLQLPQPPLCSSSSQAHSCLRAFVLTVPMLESLPSSLLFHPSKSIWVNYSLLLQICQYITSSVRPRLAALLKMLNHFTSSICMLPYFIAFFLKAVMPYSIP